MANNSSVAFSLLLSVVPEKVVAGVYLQITILLDFSLTVKAAPLESVIRVSQP